MLLTTLSLILDAGVIPPGTASFPYFAAAQNGLASALCACLLINGFVGFQLYEDGTALSVWLLRLCSLGMFVVSGAVSLLTFKGWGGLGPQRTVGLFVVLYVFNAVFLTVYVVMQFMLVLNTLQDRWPLGDIAFGVFFFVVGQVVLYVLGSAICEGAQHYLDGLFFASICNLLAVMMVYKVCCAGGWSRWLGDGWLMILRSTGTLSLRRTSSSASALSRAIGRSRSRCCRQRTSAVRRFTWTAMPTIRTACIFSRRISGDRIMAGIDWARSASAGL